MTRRRQRWYDWPGPRNAKTRGEARKAADAAGGAVRAMDIEVTGPYAELYPDASRRLREMARSDDPQIRRVVDAYLAALQQRVDARSNALRRTYGLTDAETRVALHLMAGGAIAGYAEANGVSVGTVRTQVKSIFAKTGVNRQAALARLGAQLDRG
jgi:DNA-binding CsgD family transcriptional regulator